MRFFGFLKGNGSVRSVLVATLEGEKKHESGPHPPQWTAVRLARVAGELALGGELVGLGALSSATLRGTKSLGVVAQRGELCALLDLEPNANVAELEAALGREAWTTKSEPPAPSEAPTREEPATIRPRPPAAAAAPPRPRPAPRSGSKAPPRPAGQAPARATAGLSALVNAVRSVRLHSSSTPNAATESARELQAAPVASPPLPALQAAPASAVQPAAPPASPALFTGSLRHFALPDLLEFLRVGQRTGTLVCASAAGVGTVHLRRGRILAAASPDIPPMGEFLVERGALTRSQLHDAQREHSQATSNGLLTAVLLSQKVVPRDVLHEALMLHVVKVVGKLMSWETGDFSFDPTTVSEQSDTEHELELDPQGVLLNIFKSIDDANRG